jgi:hypothetical protein
MMWVYFIKKNLSRKKVKKLKPKRPHPRPLSEGEGSSSAATTLVYRLPSPKERGRG